MKGAILQSSLSGKELRSVHDKIGIPPVESLFDLVPGTEHDQLYRFLAEIEHNKTAFNWRFNIRGLDGFKSCYLAGALENDHITIVCAETRGAISQIYRDLIEINNEQSNTLRLLLKEQSLAQREQGEQDRYLYEELARVNNELATLQRELYKKNQELAQLNEQKNFFMGILAHDLRNPLSLILGYSEFLREELGGSIGTEHREFLDQIERTSKFMVRLVNDLLDVSKIELGQLQLDLEAINLRDVIEESVSLNSTIADRKDVTLMTDLRSSGVIQADRLKISQVLNNLISNAIKYSPRSSSVSISLEEDEREIVVQVSDRGPGIPADELNRIFQPFERGSIRPTEGEHSTGLGLAIVKRIVEGHGGKLEVTSTPGQGSVFSFKLPKRM